MLSKGYMTDLGDCHMVSMIMRLSLDTYAKKSYHHYNGNYKCMCKIETSASPISHLIVRIHFETRAKRLTCYHKGGKLELYNILSTSQLVSVSFLVEWQCEG